MAFEAALTPADGERDDHAMGVKFAASALVLLLALAALACNQCPEPALPHATTATWTTAATAPRAVIVVRWTPEREDPFPDAYYADASLMVTDADSSPVENVRFSARHELTLTLRDVDAFISSGSRVTLYLPDQRGYLKCSHPGRGDSFSATLDLDLHVVDHTVRATFEPIAAHHGACDVGSGRANDGGALIGSLFVIAGIWWRRAISRRRHVGGRTGAAACSSRSWTSVSPLAHRRGKPTAHGFFSWVLSIG